MLLTAHRSPHAALFVALASAFIGITHDASADSPRACFDAAEQGQSLRDQAKLRDARDLFRTCAAATCPPLVQRDCAQWLTDVEARLPSVIVTANDSIGHELIDVPVLVDGKPFTNKLDGVSIPVDPGVHVFRFEFRGAAPLEQQVVIRDGEKYQKLHVDQPIPTAPVIPPPSEPTHGNGYKTAAIISAGVGVVALGAFTYFGISGVSDYTHDEHTCAPRCGSAADDVRTELRVADVALGVTVVAAALTVFFYLESRSHARASTTAAATFSVEPQPPFRFSETGFRF